LRECGTAVPLCEKQKIKTCLIFYWGTLEETSRA